MVTPSINSLGSFLFITIITVGRALVSQQAFDEVNSPQVNEEVIHSHLCRNVVNRSTHLLLENVWQADGRRAGKSLCLPSSSPSRLKEVSDGYRGQKHRSSNDVAYPT
ncbi:hypothetical protein LA080_015163 [Diaporthe eres]|nr:hypothetical protein LA080_015163 [Diaporthe eres]